MMTRIMAEQNVKPESVERRIDFVEKLKAFRQRVAQSSEVVGRAGKSLSRKGCEAQLKELAELTRKFDTAAVKDSFSFNLPITKLPKLGTLDEEIERARAEAAQNA